jgi:hypothetical protein
MKGLLSHEEELSKRPWRTLVVMKSSEPLPVATYFEAGNG